MTKIFAVVLAYLVWSAGSTYWYVCKIKHLCPDPPASEVAETPVPPPPKEESPKPTSDFSSVKIEENFDANFDIRFPSGKTDYISAPGLEDFLKRLAEYAKTHPDKTLTIIGHTDTIGEEKVNEALGLGRAQSVAASIVGFGAKPAQVKALSKGEAEPLKDNATPEGRQVNRRVQIKID